MKLFLSIGVAVAAFGSAAAATLSFTLEKPGRVTAVVEDGAGARVRNLVSDLALEAGPQTLEWDGRDDNGEPVEPGEYRWRGLVHGTISASYLGSFYSPGTTPWKRHTRPGGWNIRAFGGGGWLSDHEPPWCVYTDDRAVYLGCRIAEAGDAIIRCDLDGEKTWGQLWLGLSGANAMCTDGDVLYLAGEKGWQGDRLGVFLYDVGKCEWVPLPEEAKARPRVLHDAALVRETTADFGGIAGMYLDGDYIVLALSDKDRLAFFNRRDGRFDHEAPMRNAEALALRPSTKILRGMATDSDGNVYRCATNAEDQCVKVFSPDGGFIRAIGRPGGRREGKYDPLAMGNPVDVAVDAKGLVWVCENSYTPKRVSVWTREGALVREYVGTPAYGGGGSLDGRTAYYGGMRFRFDEDFSRAELDAVMWIPSEHADLPERIDLAGSCDFVSFRGRRYIVDDDGACKRCSAIFEEVGDRLVPRVIVGNGANGAAYLWQDGEKIELDGLVYGAEWAMRFGPNLELVFRTRDGASLVVMAPWEGEGLRYNPSKAETVALPREFVPVCSLAMTPDADAFIVNRGGCGDQGAKENIFGAVSRDGRALWTYPNPFPSNCHNSPLPRRGELRHTLGIEGFATPGEGGAGALMLLNGNKGTRYIFTTDGLFVQEIFADMRGDQGVTQNFPEAVRGIDLGAKSLGDECFGGWMGEVDGRVFVIEGKDSLNVCELDGAGSVRRLEGGKVALAERARPLDELAGEERPPIRVVNAGGFGLPGEWWKLAENRFKAGANSTARFALASAGEFRIWIDVDDPTPFENAGTDPQTLFHTGDAVDFRWEGDVGADPGRTAAARGDLRFVIAPVGDGVAVVRYVFVDPEADTPPVEFASPVSTFKVARVERVGDAKVGVRRREGGYELEVSLPWHALGEAGAPKAGAVRRGDMGVIFGDETGSRVVRRAYCFDPGSQEVSDIPSETRVNPSAWGRLEF